MPLMPSKKRHVRVSHRDAFEVLIVAAHQVEEVLAAVPIEDHLAIARALDHDGFFGRAALGQVIGSIEDISHGEITGPRRAIHVMEAVAHIQAGVDQNRVARLNARRKSVLVIEMRQAHVVGGHQTGERRLLLGSGPPDRIDMINVPAFAGLGLAPRTHRDYPLGVAGHAIRIGKHEAALVFGIGIEIENTAGKHVRSGIPKQRVSSRVCSAWPGRSADLLTLQPHQRQRWPPIGFSFLPIGGLYLGVAVIVACDPPLKAQRDQRRRLGRELPGDG